MFATVSVEVEEEEDGTVQVTLKGHVFIKIAADGKGMCDVSVSSDIMATATAEGSTDGLYAFVVGEIVGQAVCEGL